MRVETRTKPNFGTDVWNFSSHVSEMKHSTSKSKQQFVKLLIMWLLPLLCCYSLVKSKYLLHMDNLVFVT